MLQILEKWGRTALAVYLLLLISATHYPTDVLKLTGPLGVDKVIHLIAYGLLAALLTNAFPKAAGWRVLAVVLTIGVLDELTQPYFNRMCDPFDFVADAVGATLGMLAWRRLRRGLPVASALHAE